MAGEDVPESFTMERRVPLARILVVLEIYLISGGVLSLLGYATDLRRLTDWANTGISIQPNTSVAITAAGVALMALGRGASRVAAVAGAFVGLVGAVTLFEHLSGVDLGIDALLMFERTWGRAGITAPGRMGPAGATCCMLLGAGYVLAARPVGHVARRWAAGFALVSLAISTLGLIGYLFGSSTLYSLPRSTAISLQTASFILVASFAVLLCVPEREPLRLLGSATEGGGLVRRALPAVTLVPICVGLAFLVGERAGYYHSAFGSAARTLVEILLFTVLVWWAGAAVNVEARRRARAEEQRAELLDKERAARAEAERATRLKDEFLSTLSHELRTPLSAILGWTQIMKKRLAGDERSLAALDVIERNGRAQAKLITDLLDISRITAGTAELELSQVDLAAVVASAVDAILPSATGKQVRIRTDIEAGLPQVKGDPARLEQIVWNLLSNAVKFTPRGGRVDLALARCGDQVELRIEDSGQGITGEFMPHLFERFRQADGSAGRRHGGLGIGLSIVKQLAELHGGSVEAASLGPERGATFSVKLPIEPNLHMRTTSRRKASLPPTPVPESSRLNGAKLLVVDDEPDALAMIRHFCEEHGACVTTAPSASRALELVREESFDAIVSDIAMPGGDGYELLGAIRELGVRTPALALTAFAREEDRARALSAGFEAHVTKPIDQGELVETLARLVAPAAKPASGTRPALEPAARGGH